MAGTILIIDDSYSMRESVKFILNGNGYSVIEAADGADGFNKLKNSKIDFVITDINMPNLNGINLIKKISSDSEKKMMPILVLTTESEFEMIRKGRDVGATGWVVKPFNNEKLLTAVKKVL